MRAAHVVVIALAAACGAASPSTMPSASPPPAAPVRVLFFSATTGFRHDSIPAARQALTSLGASTGAFTITASEDVADLSAAKLANVDVVFFGMTTGELPLSAETRRALLDFVQSGHGFIGVHSATDTLYDWPEYGTLIGAYFKEHPWTQTATVTVEDRAHPINAGLGASFAIQEEFYAFRENPRPRVHVLLSLDTTSVGASGDYPLAWTQSIGSGRMYYNALGHFQQTWADQRFLSQMRAAIAWTSGR